MEFNLIERSRNERWRMKEEIPIEKSMKSNGWMNST